MTIMIIISHVYFELTTKELEDDQSKANTHIVLTFDIRGTQDFWWTQQKNRQRSN